jgi:hypothetical protein
MPSLGVHETHGLDAFRKLGIVDGFLKLAPHYSDLLAPGAGQLLGVHRKERYFRRYEETRVRDNSG